MWNWTLHGMEYKWVPPVHIVLAKLDCSRILSPLLYTISVHSSGTSIVIGLILQPKYVNITRSPPSAGPYSRNQINQVFCGHLPHSSLEKCKLDLYTRDTIILSQAFYKIQTLIAIHCQQIRHSIWRHLVQFTLLVFRIWISCQEHIALPFPLEHVQPLFSQSIRTQIQVIQPWYRLLNAIAKTLFSPFLILPRPRLVNIFQLVPALSLLSLFAQCRASFSSTNKTLEIPRFMFNDEAVYSSAVPTPPYLSSSPAFGVKQLSVRSLPKPPFSCASHRTRSTVEALWFLSVDWFRMRIHAPVWLSQSSSCWGVSYAIWTFALPPTYHFCNKWDKKDS